MLDRVLFEGSSSYRVIFEGVPLKRNVLLDRLFSANYFNRESVYHKISGRSIEVISIAQTQA
jgi:hypothetical protein